MTITLDLIGIATSDMAASLAFYRSLGVDIPAESDSQPHVEVVLANGLRLAWDSDEVITSFDAGFDTSPRTGRVSLAFLCASPSAVDETFAELVAEGHHGHLEPWDAVWGQRYAVVHDPDGNTVDLFAPLDLS
jgi:catechol 2,3-dioxygenase-like lactoylglutathione lyase family enzyme